MRRALPLLMLLAMASLAGAQGRTPLPTVHKAPAGTQCVAPPAEMRRKHMEMLKHQRDDTVRGGIRGAKASLRGCVDCHAGAQSHSVVQTSTDFCSSCHAYAAVTIDCFECHSGTRSAAK